MCLSCYILNIHIHSGGKVNILGSNSISYCEKKCSHKHVSNSIWLPIHNSFNQVHTIFPSKPNSIRFLFVGLDAEQCLQKKGRYTREMLAHILDAAACIKKC